MELVLPPPSLRRARLKGRIVRTALLVLVSLFFAYPLWWMATTSLKTLAEAHRVPPSLLPRPIVWQNYAEATAGAIDFLRQLRNTLFLCVMNVAGTVVSCSLVAYGFARIPWPGRDKFFGATLATMMIPGPVLLVPMYQLYRGLGWIGTFQPLWVPAFFASAYNIFLIRQFFLGIPRDLSEAARIDGCSEWRICWQVVLPLAKPALTVVGLFSFLFVWNDFMGPLIYLTDPEHFTLALGLQSYERALGGTEINLLMAGATLMVAPILVLFLAAQRTFIEGISLTGLKG